MKIKIKLGYLYMKIWEDTDGEIYKDLLEVIEKNDSEYPMRIRFQDGSCYNWSEKVSSNNLIELGHKSDYPEYCI